MRLRPLLHDKLVVRAVFNAVFLVWAVIIAFRAILDFASELDSQGNGAYSLAKVALYILCTIPDSCYEFFPTAALIGSLLGLGGLAATSELTALRAAGISRWRICVGAVVGLALVTVLMMVDMETLGAAGEQAADAIQISEKTGDLMVSKSGGVWARDGNVYVDARGGAKRMRRKNRDGVDLLDVRVFRFDANGTLLDLTQASKAEYIKGGWNLLNVVRTQFYSGSVVQSAMPVQKWVTGLKPETVLAGVEKPHFQSTKELRTNIEYMHHNDVDAGEYENAYWARCVYPLNVLAMCLAALPFAFGQLRSGGFGKRLFSGIMFGLTFFLLQKFAQNLATVYHLPLWGAHLAPPLLILASSQLYFRKRT